MCPVWLTAWDKRYEKIADFEIFQENPSSYSHDTKAKKEKQFLNCFSRKHCKSPDFPQKHAYLISQTLFF